MCFDKYNAGCWFGAANKAFNSGTKKPSRQGQVSPWAMALACEAFGLFQGQPFASVGQREAGDGSVPLRHVRRGSDRSGRSGKISANSGYPFGNSP